jgi:uncharacterized tellurite resistance protein B-like protein
MDALQLSWLVQLVKIDGVIDDAEEIIIRRIARNAGIDLGQLAEPGGFDDLDDSNKVRLFYQCMLLAAVDGELSASEIDFLKGLGKSLGINADNQEKALEMLENGQVDLSPEQIFDLLN